ncbi:MAG: hypothetical protein ACM3PB_00760 [Betaproteobacteria bacterium]
MTANRQPYPDLFDVSIGGYTGKSSRARWQDGLLFCESASYGYETECQKTVTPAPAQWALFRGTMERIGVWQWSGEYVDPAILDGTGWSVEITWNDRYVKAEGSNAYPGSNSSEYSKAFQSFIAALNRLIGIKDFFE